MDQITTLNILKSWRNVFLTGQAWSWKTYVINQFVERLWACDIPVAITASTWIAATHIWWVTIHSRSGVGIKNRLSERDLDLLEQKEYIHKNVSKPKVLIIDEVSMLSSYLLDMVDRIAKKVRRDDRAFGGLQVVFVWDFFQLPPVVAGMNDTKRFAFAAKSRNASDLAFCYLTTQYRQWDGGFRTLLNQLRVWDVQEDSLTLLKSRMIETSDGDIHENTVHLYTHNADVDRVNAERLAELDEEEVILDASGMWDSKLIKVIAKNMLAPQVLRLKVWAIVLFVKNNAQKWYVNGTSGKVVWFTSKDYPIVQCADWNKIVAEPELWSIEQADEILASVSQVPLKLARAITVHKSQGMTLDRAIIDLSKVFEPWQAYVALSRLRTIEWLILQWVNPHWLRAHPLVVRADAYFAQQSADLESSFDHLSSDDRQKVHKKFVNLIGGTYVSQEDIPPHTITQKSYKSSQSQKSNKVSTIDQTLELVQQSLSIKQIAQERDLTEQTIWSHIFKIRDSYPDVSLEQYKWPQERIKNMSDAVTVLSANQANLDAKWQVKLSALFHHFNKKYSYDEIKQCLLFV